MISSVIPGGNYSYARWCPECEFSHRWHGIPDSAQGQRLTGSSDSVSQVVDIELLVTWRRPFAFPALRDDEGIPLFDRQHTAIG